MTMTMTSRGPLPHVILTACGQDVRLCTACWECDSCMTADMDLTIGELLQAVVRDEHRALTSRTLWSCDSVIQAGLQCRQGIDLPVVIAALRAEARLRGLGDASGLDPKGLAA